MADESTKELMIRFFRERRGAVTTDAALARAIRSQIRDGGTIRSPFYWAPFQLSGSGI